MLLALLRVGCVDVSLEGSLVCRSATGVPHRDAVGQYTTYSSQYTYYLHKGGFVFTRVRLLVCMFIVCWFVCFMFHKIIFIKLGGKVKHLPRKNLYNFGAETKLGPLIIFHFH